MTQLQVVTPQKTHPFPSPTDQEKIFKQQMDPSVPQIACRHVCGSKAYRAHNVPYNWFFCVCVIVV